MPRQPLVYTFIYLAPITSRSGTSSSCSRLIIYARPPLLCQRLRPRASSSSRHYANSADATGAISAASRRLLCLRARASRRADASRVIFDTSCRRRQSYDGGATCSGARRAIRAAAITYTLVRSADAMLPRLTAMRFGAAERQRRCRHDMMIASWPMTMPPP